MAEQQDIKTYEVGFSMERFQHTFYISCPEGVDVKNMAHAVFHYFDTPPEWGRKVCITAIAAIKPGNCQPDFLHIDMVSREEIPMPDESEESHQTVRKAIRQVVGAGHVPMAIYDEEKKIMTVYATRRVEPVAQGGKPSSVVMNFSNFGGMPGQKKV